MRRGTAARMAALCTLVGLVVAACTDENEALPPIRPVLFVVAVERTTTTIGPFAGSIEPRYTVALGFQVFGRLIARDVNVGDIVTKGERLAAIDPAVQAIAVRSAQASLNSAEAQLAAASAAEDRMRTLLDQRVVATSRFELAQQNRETGAANVTQAKDQLDKAQAELGYTQLYSNVNGVVTALSAEVGQTVTAGQTIVTVARPDIKEAVFDVPDALATALPRAAAFTVVWELNPSFAATGQVREVAPEADPTTRARRVRLTLDNPPEVFLLGTTVFVTRTVDIAPQIDLPITALLERDSKTMVWVIDPRTKTVALRDVGIGARNGGMMTVTKGISAGELIVIAGVHSLSPGQQVNINGANP